MSAIRDLSTTSAGSPKIPLIMWQSIAVVLCCASGLLPAFSQQIQVNRQNKTIAITADDSVSVDPEVAIITVGYQNYAPTKDAAYDDNVRVSNEVTKALLSRGVQKSAVETESLRLERAERDEKWTIEEKKERQFQATQTWTIHVTAERAQAVVDTALRAGANVLEAVDWNVSDPKALQAKAGAAALTKAKTIAEQMAKGLNAKLGDLVYASNRAPISGFSGWPANGRG
ncbi:MAG TPA: SIMPL domain-containing protein [Terriglobales bacterium]|nr:SIMPL domain-containing protein [Terriglobales bacterium]